MAFVQIGAEKHERVVRYKTPLARNEKRGKGLLRGGEKRQV